MISIGNTIFGVLLENRPVDWGLIIKDVIAKLAFKVGNSKPSFICPFVFHLYHTQELLKSGEIIAYEVATDKIKYNVTFHLKP